MAAIACLQAIRDAEQISIVSQGQTSANKLLPEDTFWEESS